MFNFEIHKGMIKTRQSPFLQSPFVGVAKMNSYARSFVGGFAGSLVGTMDPCTSIHEFVVDVHQGTTRGYRLEGAGMSI